MTTIQRCLAATALAVGIGLLVAGFRADDDHPGAAGGEVAASPTAGAPVARGADGLPLEPTEGMLESQWRRIQMLRAAAAAGGQPASDGAAAPGPDADGDELLAGGDLAAVDPAAFEQVVGSLGAVRDERLARLGECNRMREARRAPGAADAPLDLQLSIVSTDGVGRVVAVDADWPEDVDAAAADCFRDAYVGHEFATDHDYRYRYQWSVCAPGPGARDDGEHPEIPATVVREI